jgi:hypothetical protein
VLTPRSLTIAGLALCLTAAGTMAPVLAGTSAAAPARPQVTVIGHVSTYLKFKERNPDRSVLGHRLTLHITGSHFGPGNLVRIAVVDTAHLHVMARAVTHAQSAGQARPNHWVCNQSPAACAGLNSDPGSISFWVRFNPAPAAGHVLVLYQSAGDPGQQTVTLR